MKLKIDHKHMCCKKTTKFFLRMSSSRFRMSDVLSDLMNPIQIA